MESPQKMSLAQVAKQLELLEETLIYRFLDRIQFAYHPALYQTNGVENGSRAQASRAENEGGTPPKVAQILQHSLLGLRLEAHETMEQRFGRYSVAEEFPFSWKLRFETEAETQVRPNAAQSPQPKALGALENLEDLQTEPLAASLSILQKLHGQAPQGPNENQAHSRNQALGKNQLQETAQMVKAVKADLPLSLQCIRQIGQCDAIVRDYLPFLAKYCAHINDMQYGSALEHDVMVLQCISRRIHFGALYVAEIKFSEQESVLRPLILSWQKAQGQAAQRQAAQWQTEIERGADIRSKILEHITRPEVEERILQRVYDKTSMIQQFSLGQNSQRGQDKQSKQEPSVMQRRYLEPENMRRFYADCIIPLTKEGELAYLYRRV